MLEIQLTSQLRRTIDTMRDLGFSQADREAEIKRQTWYNMKTQTQTQKMIDEFQLGQGRSLGPEGPCDPKCIRCKTADALPDYPNCEACREVMRGWLATDIEMTQGKRSSKIDDDDLFHCGCGEPTKHGEMCMQCRVAGSEN